MSEGEQCQEPSGDDAPQGGASRYAPARPPFRLSYLDGIRGIAAIYVVMFHIVLGFGGQNLSGIGRALRRACAFGHEAVAVFIVLSGYCLALPALHKQPARLTLSLRDFVRPRALRILPPYFAALGLSLLLMTLVPILRTTGTGTIWDQSSPGLELWPIVSHLLLVHNLFPRHSVQINGPLWSVATEWQIYFCFALLLLPAWRRGGLLFALLVAALLGYLPLLFANAAASSAGSWYVLLFALGTAAASVHFGNESERKLRALPWHRIAFVGCASCAVCGVLLADDFCVGLATASLLVYLTGRAAAPTTGRARLLRLLETRPLVGLGHFSYSLYLTHLPIVALCYFGLRQLGLSPLALSITLLLFAGAASLGVARVFYFAVERPSMLRR